MREVGRGTCSTRGSDPPDVSVSGRAELANRPGLSQVAQFFSRPRSRRAQAGQAGPPSRETRRSAGNGVPRMDLFHGLFVVLVRRRFLARLTGFGRRLFIAAPGKNNMRTVAVRSRCLRSGLPRARSSNAFGRRLGNPPMAVWGCQCRNRHGDSPPPPYIPHVNLWHWLQKPTSPSTPPSTTLSSTRSWRRFVQQVKELRRKFAVRWGFGVASEDREGDAGEGGDHREETDGDGGEAVGGGGVRVSSPPCGNAGRLATRHAPVDRRVPIG